MDIDRLQPVFIMGCPRSGTTMIASQLGVHSDVMVLPELPFFPNILLCAQKRLPGGETYQHLVNHPKFGTINITLNRDHFIDAWNDGAGWKTVLSMIFEEYYTKNGSLSALNRKLFWVEHYPSNVQYFFLYLKFFPNAKFIHLVRDPRAIYSSMKPLPRWPIGEPLRLVRTWLHFVSKANALGSYRPDIVMEMRYEDYIRDSSGLRRICDYLGIEFEQPMLEGGGIILPEFTRDQHRLTMRRSDPGQAEAWRTKINPREADVIAALCFEWMVRYGYLSPDEHFSKPSKQEKLVWFIRRLRRHISANIVKRIRQ